MKKFTEPKKASNKINAFRSALFQDFGSAGRKRLDNITQEKARLKRRAAKELPLTTGNIELGDSLGNQRVFKFPVIHFLKPFLQIRRHGKSENLVGFTFKEFFIPFEDAINVLVQCQRTIPLNLIAVDDMHKVSNLTIRQTTLFASLNNLLEAVMVCLHSDNLTQTR